ncbi:MAG TPA: hypothetical protein VF828_04500 [Patescibacteria group bacterium]
MAEEHWKWPKDELLSWLEGAGQVTEQEQQLLSERFITVGDELSRLQVLRFRKLAMEIQTAPLSEDEEKTLQRYKKKEQGMRDICNRRSIQLDIRINGINNESDRDILGRPIMLRCREPARRRG